MDLADRMAAGDAIEPFFASPVAVPSLTYVRRWT
jgi:hypothetical protein